MPFKAVFSDMDGTLLAANHKFSEFTVNVLKQLQAKGVAVVLATGRPYPAVFNVIDESGLQPDFIVTTNGARIHDATRTIVARHDLDPKIVKAIAQVRQQPKEDGTLDEGCPIKTFSTNFYPEDKWITDKPSQEIVEAFFHSILPVTVDYQTCSDSTYESVHEMWLMGETHHLLAMKKYVELHHGNVVQVMMSQPTVIDIVSKTVDKGSALREICSWKGWELDEVLAFGDSMNDEPMLRAVPHSFVMTNSLPMLKETLPDREVPVTKIGDLRSGAATSNNITFTTTKEIFKVL
eukprot:gene8277-5796_t